MTIFRTKDESVVPLNVKSREKTTVLTRTSSPTIRSLTVLVVTNGVVFSGLTKTMNKNQVLTSRVDKIRVVSVFTAPNSGDTLELKTQETL